MAIFYPMKPIQLLVLLLCFRTLSAQDVAQIIEFDLNTTTENDHVVLYDVKATHCVLKVNSNDFSLSNGFTYDNQESDFVFLFCNSSLEEIWHKAFRNAVIADAVIGSDGVFIYGERFGDLIVIDDEVEIHGSAFLAKISFSGEWEWIKEYGGLQQYQNPKRSLILDSNENVFVASSLWNYDHPASSDTLFFQSDTCMCNALSPQFSVCTIAMKWDVFGNELWYHVLDSEDLGYVLDVGVDSEDNLYLSGRHLFSSEPSFFAGTSINGGDFVLSFGSDGSERWVYYRSDQVDSYNSTPPFFLFDSDQSIFFDVRHDSHQIVTETDTLTFQVPVNGPVTYNTIHELDIESGALVDVDLFGYFSQFDQIHAKGQGIPYMISSPHPDFTHSFPPYSYEPNPPEGLILSKEPFGAYSEPVTLSLLQGTSGSHIASDLIYLELQHNTEPISFTLDGTEYTTGTSNCVVVLDMSNATTDAERESEAVLFPNPVMGGVLTIDSRLPIERITLYDLQGKEVLDRHDPGNVVDVSSVSPGTYLVRVYNSSSIQTQRIVVMGN